MPINILETVLLEGTDKIPGWQFIKTYAPPLIAAGTLKFYFAGTYNTWERDLHGKVYMITGGTSGLGKYVAYELAKKGAQIILLTRSINDGWLIDYIDDLREKADNFMIYAEECDLASLHSIRKFATRWLDNSPPRRLDGVICCAADTLPIGLPRQVTLDGVERQMGINYLGHYHLLTLLSPSLRVQPPDRDVRVILTSCASQSLGTIDLTDPLWLNKRYPSSKPWKVFGSSKLSLSMFAKEYQRRLSAFERKDKFPCNIRVNIVNPGIMRSPSATRFISMGSIWGLFLYMILYPIWFIFFKNAIQGGQSIVHSICSQQLAKMDGGNYISECTVVNPSRKEFYDEDLQKGLFDLTEKLINELEVKSARERKKNEATATSEKKDPLDDKKQLKKQNKTTSNKKPRAKQEAKIEEISEVFSEMKKSKHGIIQDNKKEEVPLFPEVNESIPDIIPESIPKAKSKKPVKGKKSRKV